jgi:hypothetical protein
LPFLGENAVVGTIEFAAVLGALGYAAYSKVEEGEKMGGKRVRFKKKKEGLGVGRKEWEMS